MNRIFPSIDRGRPFSKGDYLVHVSGMMGIATGEVIYEPRNPVEKTKIILNGGFPLIDYCIKFCPATEREKQIFLGGSTAEEIIENGRFAFPITNSNRKTTDDKGRSLQSPALPERK
jgi:hypothetical protein